VTTRGLTIRKSLPDDTDEDFDRVAALDLKGIFLLFRAFAATMRVNAGRLSRQCRNVRCASVRSERSRSERSGSERSRRERSRRERASRAAGCALADIGRTARAGAGERAGRRAGASRFQSWRLCPIAAAQVCRATDGVPAGPDDGDHLKVADVGGAFVVPADVREQIGPGGRPTTWGAAPKGQNHYKPSKWIKKALVWRRLSIEVDRKVAYSSELPPF